MQISTKLNNEGFLKKLRNLRQLDTMFQQLPGHAAHFLRNQVVDHELNYGYDGQHIGRISGNLAASVTVEQRPYYGAFKINGTLQAPYAPYVSNWAKRNYGYTPKESVLDRAAEPIHQMVKAEWHRAADTIERGLSYVYHNPFYQAI